MNTCSKVPEHIEPQPNSAMQASGKKARRLIAVVRRLMCTSKREHMVIMTFLILTLNSRLLVEANDSQQPQVRPATPGHSTGAPRFDEFRVHTKRQGQQHWLSLGRCDQVFGKGEDFGHRLVRERAKAGRATFAGHYSILVCSCGTECGVVSIVDLSSGRIYDFEHMSQACADALSNYRDFLYFRADSSLLILIGSPPKLKSGAERNKGCAVRYYRWTGRQLILLKEAPVSKNAAANNRFDRSARSRVLKVLSVSRRAPGQPERSPLRIAAGGEVWHHRIV